MKKKSIKKLKVLEWPHQSSDLNQTEILGMTLKKAIHVHKPITWLSIHSILIHLSLSGSREGMWNENQNTRRELTQTQGEHANYTEHQEHSTTHQAW